jgi:hypothetical protein
LCSEIVFAVIGLFTIAGRTAGSGAVTSMYTADGDPMGSVSDHIFPLIHFGLFHLSSSVLACFACSIRAVLELMLLGAEQANVLEPTELGCALPPIESFTDRYVGLIASWSINVGSAWTLNDR